MEVEKSPEFESIVKEIAEETPLKTPIVEAPIATPVLEEPLEQVPSSVVEAESLQEEVLSGNENTELIGAEEEEEKSLFEEVVDYIFNW